MSPQEEIGVSFETPENTGLEVYTYADRVKHRLAELGLRPRPQPQLDEEHAGVFPGLRPGQYFDGRLPVVIRKLSLDQLSALYSLPYLPTKDFCLYPYFC